MVRKGTWRPEDRADARYHYVPVEVPAGTPGLRVELAYDRTAGVLDLGVFDPAGQFRGYSGGARDSFAIGPDRATPGYLPGELPTGEWQVFLGLHRVPAGGLAWEIRATPAAPPPPDGAAGPPPPPERPHRRTDLPTMDGLRWYAGDLHAHTCLLYTSPSPRDRQKSRMPSSA